MDDRLCHTLVIEIRILYYRFTWIVTRILLHQVTYFYVHWICYMSNVERLKEMYRVSQKVSLFEYPSSLLSNENTSLSLEGAAKCKTRVTNSAWCSPIRIGLNSKNVCVTTLFVVIRTNVIKR